MIIFSLNNEVITLTCGYILIVTYISKLKKYDKKSILSGVPIALNFDYKYKFYKDNINIDSIVSKKNDDRQIMFIICSLIFADVDFFLVLLLKLELLIAFWSFKFDDDDDDFDEDYEDENADDFDEDLDKQDEDEDNGS